MTTDSQLSFREFIQTLGKEGLLAPRYLTTCGGVTKSYSLRRNTNRRLIHRVRFSSGQRGNSVIRKPASTKSIPAYSLFLMARNRNEHFPLDSNWTTFLVVEGTCHALFMPQHHTTLRIGMNHRAEGCSGLDSSFYPIYIGGPPRDRSRVASNNVFMTVLLCIAACSSDSRDQSRAQRTTIAKGKRKINENQCN